MILTFLLILVTSSGLAAESKRVQVQGQCQTKVVPDRGSITFMAENQSKSQKEAFAKTNQQINSLKQKIKKLKLPDLELKNTNYNVYPVREYENKKYVNKGMRVSLGLEVTTSDIQRLGDTLTLASEEGIQNVGSLRMFLSQQKQKEIYLKCLDVATEDATMKARQLSKKMGFGLGEVIKVIEAPLQTIREPVYQSRAMLKSGGDPAPALEPGAQEFSTTLEVSFAIK